MSPRKDLAKTGLMALIAALLPIFALEIGLRFLIKDSDLSYGKLFGVELPPVRVIPYRSAPDRDIRGWHDQLTVDGRRIAKDDIWGRVEPDPLVGYVPEKSSQSVNAWYQTNSIGARSRTETSKAKPPGVTRIALFGDSYAQGYGLKQEDTFASKLTKATPKLDVLNFGVAGYGLGQAYLRYQQVASKFDHDIVLLMFVPRLDLWRDLNTIRYLGEGWQSFTVLPRFVIEAGALRLVKGPYQSMPEVYSRNHDSLSPELREHLEKYEPFYVGIYHTPPPVLSSSVIFKVFAAFYWKMKVRNLKNPRTMYEVQNEHLQVTKQIINAFKKEAADHGAKFALMVYPTHEGPKPEVTELKPGTPNRNQWDRMVSFLRQDNTLVLDFLPEIHSLGNPNLDTSYDGTHLGPEGSEILSKIISGFLIKEGLIGP